MRLSFKSPHLSITAFPDIEIPDFALITGPNGAGKSHLLHAIENGHIQSDILAGHRIEDQVRYFDWITLVPNDTGYFSGETINGERLQIYQQIRNIIQTRNLLAPLRQLANKYDILQEYRSNPLLLCNMSDDAIIHLFPSPPSAMAFIKDFRSKIAEISKTIIDAVNIDYRHELLTVSESLNIPVFLLTESDIVASTIPSWGTSSLFQQSFARLFVAYRNLYLENSLRELANIKGDGSITFLSEIDFLKKHGPPPWDFVNDSLQRANLGFSINNPDLFSFSQYLPQLTKNDSGVIIPFNALSSGEKILMSFAFCVYYANDKRQLSIHPKIILLDEIDAPLHPSMSKNLIQTIIGTLVSVFDIKVILATHSPSTVALAPEGSIFVMEPGMPGLQKVTKNQALNVLTIGVPTIALSFDGRRQVLVESNADALTYDLLYKLCMQRIIASERSLEFIPTGPRSHAGAERNTGCDTVRKLVAALSEAGNMSVFGLIDWDGKNQPSDRVIVLAFETRNGLENVLLDPLLVAALICRDFGDKKHCINMPESLSWMDFVNLEPIELQVYATTVVEIALGEPATTPVAVSYVGGFELQIDERYLRIDDHALEAKLIEKFPFLNQISRQNGGGSAGKLLQHVVSRVLSDKPEFTPSVVEETFRNLLERNNHPAAPGTPHRHHAPDGLHHLPARRDPDRRANNRRPPIA